MCQNVKDVKMSFTWWWMYSVILVNIFTEYVKVGKYLSRGYWGESLAHIFAQKW